MTVVIPGISIYICRSCVRTFFACREGPITARHTLQRRADELAARAECRKIILLFTAPRLTADVRLRIK